jgi:hypothetical protein
MLRRRKRFEMSNAPGLPDFLGTTYQNGGKYTKWPQNVPKWPQNIPNGPKIYQQRPLQDPRKFYPKLGFFVRKYTIWQPWSITHFKTFSPSKHVEQVQNALGSEFWS